LNLKNDNKYSKLLNTKNYEYAYRFVSYNNNKQFNKIINKKNKILKTRNKDELTSWTINPRSLVYSGFFSVFPKTTKGLILIKAKINENNFFGNPDELIKNLNIKEEEKIGYSLEREIMCYGEINYIDIVYKIKNKNQSLEGLAMDLINQLIPVKKIDFNDKNYYLAEI
jgi:hypothetical protein